MKYILLFLALMFAAPVFAQEQPSPSQELTAEIAKMSDTEKAKALQAIRAGESPAAAHAREWIDIGNGLGAGLAATAEKLGVVANDFAKSPVGQLAMVLIIWNYMGDDIIGWLGGLFILFTGVPFWLYQFRKTFGVYSDKGKFIHYDVRAMVGNDTGAVAFFMCVALAVIFITAIVFIA
jgi:hypothetical protein